MHRMIEQNTIDESSSVRDVIARLNTFNYEKSFILFVLDRGQKLLGSVSDGDVRRALLEGKTLDSSVKEVMNTDFFYITSFGNYIDIKKLKKNNYKIIPYLTEDKEIIDFIEVENYKAFLPLDAFILAGGRGLRMQEYTNSCPKPLLELEGKAILVHNIDRLIKFGVRNFFISVYYLKDQIIEYINKNYKNSLIKIQFIEEEEPLGTLGSLSLVKSFESKEILVINADILTNIDFEEFYLSFKKHDAALSIATFEVKVDIPYGVLEAKNEEVLDIIEKPSFSYPSNAGIYLLKQECIHSIPQESFFDATDFIKLLLQNKEKVTNFSILDYWLDIGNKAHYSKAQQDIKHINF